MAAPTRNLENGAKAFRRAAMAAAISGSDKGWLQRNPGTDRTASGFPAKGAGNPWQPCQSPGGCAHLRLQPRQQGLQELYQGIAHFGSVLEHVPVMDFLRYPPRRSVG